MRKSLIAITSFLRIFAWCIPFSWRASRYYTLLRIAGEVARPILAIGVSFLGKYVIDLLAGSWVVSDTYNTLLLLLAGLLGIALSRTLIQTITQYGQAMHSEIINNKISLTVIDRSLTADLEYFDNPAYHDKLMAVSRDSHAIAHILWSVISCISAGVSFIGVFAVLSRANMLYGLLMMAAAIPSSIAAARYTKALYMLSLDQLNGLRQQFYCQEIAFDRTYAQDMRLFNAGPRLLKRYQRIWQTLFTEKRNMSRKRAILTGFLDCLPEIVIILISVDIAFKILAGDATVGDYALYTGLVVQLSGAIQMFSYSAMQIYDNRLKIDNMKSIDQFKSQIPDTGALPLKEVVSIEFCNVSFTYPGANKPALDGMTFLLHKKQKAALVGLNGSGKSTLIKMLLRMYDPQSGTIKINGIDIKQYKMTELRANFSVFFQEMRNYSFTLRENFTFGDAGNDDEDNNDVEAAAMLSLHSAYCGDIISKSEKGLETALTRSFDEDGIELSGGQHQKLALARTFFRRHTALILDEPSSNLDPLAEQKIFENLHHVIAGKMAIFTSHRLSNVSLADRILVLENGKVVEDGTQAELLRNKQRYAELFTYQKERYTVES